MELDILEQFKRRNDIIITSADKGRAIVIQDVKLYIKLAERQLNNIQNYIPLRKDPIKITNFIVDKTIKRFQNHDLIEDKVAETLITQNPRKARKSTKKESLEDR